MSLTSESQTWAMVEFACEESTIQASRDVERASSLVRLAQRTLEQLRLPEAFARRLQGLVTGHAANVLRVRGDLKAARSMLVEAKRLWNAGSDPGNNLDPGRLLDLEASLCRDERQFQEALAHLEKAIAVGHGKERYLINKGITLCVTGEYEQSIEVLLEAKPLVERQGDLRLRNILLHNLSVNFTHVGRFAEAVALAREVRSLATQMGDKIGVVRGTWLAGRIAARLGQRDEAMQLLEEARREFDARGMGYDVILALLEIAGLLLAEGRTAEVKALAKDLARLFTAKGVHREAVAALKLFQKAVESETATAELAQRVLRYLFRARHDEVLRFES